MSKYNYGLITTNFTFEKIMANDWHLHQNEVSYFHLDFGQIGKTC